MKKILFICLIAFTTLTSCSQKIKNTTASQEQELTEKNQANLLFNQPPPSITHSLERENLIDRTLLQNDRNVMFYMYVFIEGVADPIGYYQINKVSSVNSQLTNPNQLVKGDMGQHWGDFVLPSPAEDGSYGTNGDGVFGFTPEHIYIEHNMRYIVSTETLNFTKPVNRLSIISISDKDIKH